MPRQPPGLRLFTALWPSPAARLALQQHQAGWHWPDGARPVPAARLHLTLHFLGQVPATRVGALRSALEACGGGGRLLRLTLDRAAVWPNGVAVLEAGAPPPALLERHARLAERLAAMGFATEARPYRPHVSLARRARGASPPSSFCAVPLAVRSFVLASSDRGYHLLERWPW